MDLRTELELRVEERHLTSLGDAAKRTRLAFAVVTLAAIVQIAAAWNAYVSWIRLYVLQIKSVDVVNNNGLQQGKSIVTDEFIRQWVDSTYISVPLIGIRVSIHDASVVGSLTIVVLSLWFFYCIRRENRLIADALRPVHLRRRKHARARRSEDIPVDPEQRVADSLRDELACHGVLGTQVFSTVQGNDNPIRSLDHPIERENTGAVASRIVLRAVMFLPAIAVATVVVFDWASLFFLDSPVRDDGEPLFKQIGGDARAMGQAIVMILVGTAMSIITVLFNVRSYKFQAANTALLQWAFRGRFVADDTQQNPNPST